MLFSHKKKNEIISFAAIWMDLEIIILSAARKQKTSTIWYYLFVESKIWNKSTYPQNRNKVIKSRLVVCQWGGKWGRKGSSGLKDAKYYI